MFRKSKQASLSDLFTNTQGLLSSKAQKVYVDDKEWHNQFRRQVLERIDEDIFRPLYCADNGTPNASIRLLMSMIILKEAQDWSDEQLFNNCQFHLRVRSALRLFNLDDGVPIASTYYLFRNRIVEWEEAGNENLIDKVFAQITKSQIAEFNIDGKKIRMDSKLLGSNIAKLSRYEIVHETLRLACLSIKTSFHDFLTVSKLEVLKEITTESCSSVSYRCNNSQIESKLTQLGIIIFKMLNFLKDNITEPVELLRRVFYEQFEVVEDKVILLPQERLSSSRIESPHDPDCRFRKKGEQKQKGYSINITETCNPDNVINLATSVIVEPASVSDNEFFKPAIENTQKIISQEIETVNAEGAYHSETNHEYCAEKGIDFVLSAIASFPSRLEHSVGADGNLICVDTQTGALLPTRKVVSKKENASAKWAVYCLGQSNSRYITQHDVNICLLRKQIAARSKEELNLRANVEATIFQLGYHYRANKSRYRGLIKHKIWVNTRCLWINFKRIMKYIASIDPYCVNVRLKCIQTVKRDIVFVQNKIMNAIFSLVQLFFGFTPFTTPRVWMEYSV